MTEQDQPSQDFQAPMVDFFGFELRQPNFSDADARIEWYVLAKGLDQEAQGALMATLHELRPHVAETILDELWRVGEE